ncbi:S41 family peptidase [Pedobacter gandavensis]|nr:S41 family peptidase [Pedobacter gandavensis]
METLFDSSYASINEKTTDLTFYKQLKMLLSEMKDGHLYCSLPPGLETDRNEKTLFFPLKLQFIARKVYVISATNAQIPAGSEIKSINEKPIDTIITELLKYIPADGNIQTKKYHILNNFFYFYYFIAFDESPTFDIQFKSPDGQLKNSKIKADLEQNIIGPEIAAPPQSLLDFSIEPDQTALITIKTFDPSALKGNFSDFLETSFKQIKDLKLNKLIIDLRGNSGGKDTYGSLLYSYLANKPFRYYKNLQTATNNLDFNQFKSTVSSYNDLQPSMLRRVKNNQYQLGKEAHPNLQLFQPNNYHYNGKVLFLIDGLSFSTTSEFCAIAYSHKRGDFIGEETGGTYEGNTSGVQSEFTLPNTKIQVSFGTIKYEMAVNSVAEPGKGIVPQHKVISTIQDLIERKDVQLTYAIWLANQK